MSIPHSEHGPLEVPDHLVQEIERGNCVAFLGAGFSAAAGLPGWLALIGALAEFARQGETRDWLHALLDRRPSDPKPSAAELDRLPGIGPALAGRIVAELRVQGFERAVVLDEGVLIWASRGYPIAIGGDP